MYAGELGVSLWYPGLGHFDLTTQITPTRVLLRWAVYSDFFENVIYSAKPTAFSTYRLRKFTVHWFQSKPGYDGLHAQTYTHLITYVMYSCRCRWRTLFNTLRPRQSWCHFADDIFRCIFFNKNVWISISLKFVPKVPMSNIPFDSDNGLAPIGDQ